MPQYSYHCRECGHKWEQQRPMSESRILSDCPQCGVNANHRAICAPSVHVEGANKSFNYNFGKNMDKAKEIRHRNESHYGKYEDFTGSRKGAPRRIIDPNEDVTYHGNVDQKTFEEVANNEHQN